MSKSKRFVGLLAIVLVTFGATERARAQVVTSDDAARDEATLQRVVRTASGDAVPAVAYLERRARRRRVIGTVLLGLGVPALSGGVATMVGASLSAGVANALGSLNCDDRHSCPAAQPNRSAMIAGGAFAAAGLATTIGGAVLMSLARDDRAQIKRWTMSAAPIVAPGYEGIARVGRF